MTLAAFNDNMFTLTRRETSPAQRLRAVDRIAPWGGTALYDVIVRGVQQLSKQRGRRVLVVFSDGDDRTSHSTIQTVEEAVRANDATLFMVALGRGVREAQLRIGHRAAGESERRPRALRRAQRPAARQPFTEILEELSNQYIVGYESTNAKHDGAWREVKLEVPGRPLRSARASGLSRTGKVAP